MEKLLAGMSEPLAVPTGTEAASFPKSRQLLERLNTTTLKQGLEKDWADGKTLPSTPILLLI